MHCPNGLLVWLHYKSGTPVGPTYHTFSVDSVVVPCRPKHLQVVTSHRYSNWLLGLLGMRDACPNPIHWSRSLSRNIEPHNFGFAAVCHPADQLGSVKIEEHVFCLSRTCKQGRAYAYVSSILSLRCVPFHLVGLMDINHRLYI